MDIDDPEFRGRVIAVAAQGGSRRTVAAIVGKPVSTLTGWVNRGEAYPDEEPYGSFSRDYRLAERGIAGAISGTVAMKVQLCRELMQKRLEWENRGPAPKKPKKPVKLEPIEDERLQAERDQLHQLDLEAYEKKLEAWTAAMLVWEVPPPTPDTATMEWLERVRTSRFPEDYGVSKHRKPEPDFSGQEYLDAHAMDREQLGALFADPPEPIRLALQDRAPEVYRILVEGGFDPAKPVNRKASDDETGQAEGDFAQGLAGGEGDAVDAGD